MLYQFTKLSSCSKAKTRLKADIKVPGKQAKSSKEAAELVFRCKKMNNNKNDLDQDDWVITDDDNVNHKDICIETPSFIQLFVIRRIIDKYIKNNKDNKNATKEEIIKELANVFKDDKKYQLLVRNIVTRLINDGIRTYMSEYYDEKEQANIIKDIFNKIILKKFEEEYYQLIEYKANNDKTNDSYYQNFLFNSRDLMNQIFQYLEWGRIFDKDLCQCSLVCSHWLYHAWNPNCVYYIDFSKLVSDNFCRNRKCTRNRIWQRLYNVKSIKIDFDTDESKAVNKLSICRKVEKVDLRARGEQVDKYISAVIPIMSRCKDRIKYCRIGIYKNYFCDSSNFKTPSPLRLPKAQHVEIGDLFFRRMWTNECTQLKLCEVDDISKYWCKFVINNCDCSNINNLILDTVTFGYSINEMILKQFVMKFNNLKTLEIVIAVNVDDNVLLFWQLLNPIISKNKTKVKLKVSRLNRGDIILLSERVDEKELKIDKFIIDNMCYYNDVFTSTIKLIQERDNRGRLNHLAIESAILGSQRIQLLDELKCKSITTFELKGFNIEFANALLEWKMISQKQIFVIIDVYGYHEDYNNNDEVLSLFKQLYENIYQLFVQKIALDIKIKFRKVKDSKILHSYLSLYSSYFEDKEFLSKYNSPKCNSNLCLPRDKPFTYFYIDDSKKNKWPRYYCVFGATNVQMK